MSTTSDHNDRNLLSRFRNALLLDDVLQALRGVPNGFELVEHWTQGEFHHDLVFRLGPRAVAAETQVLVVSTNCNGGVKEIVLLDAMPDRLALWHSRCPENPEFSGDMPDILASLRTTHWFDPCDLLLPDARSELRPEFRERQPGGGWISKGSHNPSESD